MIVQDNILCDLELTDRDCRTLSIRVKVAFKQLVERFCLQLCV